MISLSMMRMVIVKIDDRVMILFLSFAQKSRVAAINTRAEREGGRSQEQVNSRVLQLVSGAEAPASCVLNSVILLGSNKNCASI